MKHAFCIRYIFSSSRRVFELMEQKGAPEILRYVWAYIPSLHLTRDQDTVFSRDETVC